MKLTKSNTQLNEKDAILDMLESDNCENLTHKKVLPYLSVVQVLEGGYDITVGDQP